MRSVEINVGGYPPSKNEAKSMLAAGHVHADQVVYLLKATQKAIPDGKLLFPTQSLGLELVLTSTARPPSDATNYLGGVADVLEDKGPREKAHPGALTHLGELAQVAVYRNDNQLHEVSYRWVHGDTPAYRVRIWER